MGFYSLGSDLYNEINIALQHNQCLNFIRESNKIEGINREPHPGEITAYYRFMNLKKVKISDLQKFIKIYQPGAILRDKIGLYAKVGSYVAPKGSPEIKERLSDLLRFVVRDSIGAYKTHIDFEKLHPFTDCNGRAGRMLWLWQMKTAPLGFLHTFYYQTLSKNNP